MFYIAQSLGEEKSEGLQMLLIHFKVFILGLTEVDYNLADKLASAV
jgi:hypothetical protein